MDHDLVRCYPRAAAKDTRLTPARLTLKVPFQAAGLSRINAVALAVRASMSDHCGADWGRLRFSVDDFNVHRRRLVFTLNS